MVERQTNYTIGEGLELPSKGLIYSDHVNSHIELRSMTARDEMKRLAPSTTQFKTLADIIDGCMIEKPSISSYDMALGDYEYLLHKLRIITYGDEYKMTLRCPDCGHIIETSVHLNDLALRDFDIDTFEKYRSFTLPKSGHTVSIRPQTPRMLDEANGKARELAKKYKDADISFDILVLLTAVIDTIDGNKLDSLKLETFINNLPAMDMTKILNNVDAINACIGLDNYIEVTCQNCGGSIPTSFRFGPEFFRPSTI